MKKTSIKILINIGISFIINTMLKSLDYKLEYEKISKKFRHTLNQCIKKNKKITQSRIAEIFNKSQNAINNWLTPNEKYQCLPNAVDFLILCKILELDPSLFIEEITEAPVEKKRKLFQKWERSNITQEKNIPFIQTSVSRKIFDALSGGYKTKSITALVSPGKNGTTRAIEYFMELHKIPAFELEYFESPEKILHQLKQYEAAKVPEGNNGFIVCNNAEFFQEKTVRTLLSFFMTKYPIVLIFKERVPLLDTPFFKEKVTQCYLRTLSRRDFEKIIKGSLLNLPESAFSVLEARSRGMMHELITNIKKILKYKKQPLTRDNIIEMLLVD